MPSSPERFQKELTRIEDTILKAAQVEYDRARTDMIDLLDRYSLNDPALRREMERRIEEIRSGLLAIANRYLGAIETAVFLYVSRDLKRLKRFEPTIPDFDPLHDATVTERRRLLDLFTTRLTDFVDVIAARFRSALFDLQAQGEDTEAARARLLAIDVADGRVSEWRHGRNTINREGQRSVWTTAIALYMTYMVTAQEQANVQLYKMIVATRDRKTTETCERADGQIKMLDEQFDITGTPRYADQQMLPPFHDHCRSAPWTLTAEEAVKPLTLAELTPRRE